LAFRTSNAIEKSEIGEIMAEISLEEVNNRFNEELQRQIDGNLPEGHVYGLGHPEEILKKAGIPDLPIELKAKTLTEKADPNHKNYHPFNLSEIKDLPRYINDPVAIVAYGDKTKAVNIITEIKQDEKTFLVGLALNPEVDGKKININSVRTVFPKDIPEWQRWIKQGKALYINQAKKERLLANPRCPEDVTTAFTNNI
jgi:hypothetical protein